MAAIPWNENPDSPEWQALLSERRAMTLKVHKLVMNNIDSDVFLGRLCIDDDWILNTGFHVLLPVEPFRIWVTHPINTEDPGCDYWAELSLSCGNMSIGYKDCELYNHVLVTSAKDLISEISRLAKLARTGELVYVDDPMDDFLVEEAEKAAKALQA